MKDSRLIKTSAAVANLKLLIIISNIRYRGIYLILAYIGSLHLKGVGFSGFGYISHLLGNFCDLRKSLRIL